MEYSRQETPSHASRA